MANTLAMAYHNLSVMLDAGVPLHRSLNTVASGTKHPQRKAFLKLTDAVSKGSTLAETMTLSPKVFAPLDVTLIHAAESSGNLPELFNLLSNWHQFRQRIKKTIFSGLALPVLLIHFTAFIAPLPIYFLGSWQLTPYLSQVLTILSLFYIPAAIIFAVIRFTPKAGSLRKLLDRIILITPILGRAAYKLALSRYCWVFHMLIKAGVPITDTARTAASATGNAVIADLFKPAAASAKAGQPVSEGFPSKLPADFVNIWQVGEETGELDDVTKRLADNNTEDARFWFGELGRWFPRLVYLLVAFLMLYYIFKNFRIIYGQLLSPF